jgi:small-conductance mechanosensitive channel
VSDSWTRVALAAGVIACALVVAKLVDRRISRRELDPAAATRYGVLRRTIVSTIVFVGVFSALLLIPQIRAVAGAILASSAVLGIVIGFAAQRTLGNFIAGLMIAFTQPVRLGDDVRIAELSGVVEEIGLTYTWLRTPNEDRVAIPNEKLASEAIRNGTIRSPRTLAEVTVRVPLSSDLREIVSALGRDSREAYLTELDGEATISVRKWIPDARRSEQAESELRLDVHERLRELGVVAAVV